MTDENAPKRGRGRPKLAAGEGAVHVHMTIVAPIAAAIDQERAREGDAPSRGEMIRRLVLEALAARGRKNS